MKSPQQTVVEETPEIMDTVAALYAQGIDRLAEVQRKGLDLATRQNNEIVESFKKVSKSIPGAPGLLMLDLATNAFDRYADTQKSAIDLVLTQSHAMIGLVKSGAASLADVTEQSNSTVQKTVEKTVAAQKKALDEAAAQTQETFTKAKTQMGLTGTPAGVAADSLQRGLESLAETQKELLDFAAKPLHTVKHQTPKPHAPKPHTTAKKTGKKA